ncbi:MAG: cytochrome C3 subunit A [Planctomycetota bacterium]|nr:MAG: cytochrome C3 subunit A [Planctomycetota bacterium]
MKTKAGTVIKEKYTLKAPYKDPKRPPVEFNHKKHLQPKDKGGLGYTCKKCHHKREEDKDPQKCGECHKKDDDGKTLKFSKAMHGNCRDCHKKEDGKENDKAPKKCKVCHKKKAAGEAK